MAVKQVVCSDISGVELTDETHARVVVKLAGKSYAQSIDMSTDEAAKLVGSHLDLVTFTVFAPNVPAREAVIEAKAIERIFKGVDFEGVLSSAPRADASAPAARKGLRGTSAPKGDRPNPTAPDQFGRLRRGRVTEAEKELVRANREQASKNREAQGHPPIDWNDPKEQARYGLTA